MLLFSQCFAIACSIVVPILIAIYLGLHYEGKWKPLIFGALTYILFQMSLFMPLMSLILSNDTVSQWISAHYSLYLVFFSLTNTVFAELFRYLIIYIFLKHETTNLDGVAFGIGFGGFETALTVGMNVIISIMASSYIAKLGVTSALMAEGVGQLCLLVLQVGWTLLIMQAIRTKKKKFLLICIGLEFLITCISRLGQNVWHWNIWLLLLFMISFALIMAMYIAQIFKTENKS